jgi:plasmid stability protein
MASITLDDVPDNLLERLRARADEEHRSLAQQALYLLESVLTAKPTSSTPPGEVAAQVRAWRELSGRWESDKTIDEDVAEIYETRTPGREIEL